MSVPCELTDVHAHLDMSHFQDDLDEVMTRARDAGVTRIICAGIDISSSRQANLLADRFPGVYAAVGIHPEEAQGATQQGVEEIAALANGSHVVAIGEIGLDFYRDYGPREQQAKVLRWQLDLAARLGLPTVIHAREADETLVPLLSAWRKDYPTACPGIIHCFNGSQESAEAYLDLGFYLSLGGYIGYPSAKAVRAVVELLPMERLVLETDSPFLPPQSYRGERNEPAYLAETASTLAHLKGLSLADVAHITTLNAARIFGFLEQGSHCSHTSQ
ncbi:MAG: TatD family hydrolase [Dehalococcoidia bacterium]|nr:TatD family hydrolase [Dehalococcoidia bacterium]